jgi:repressor LexA
MYIYTWIYTFYTMFELLNEKDRKAYSLIRNRLLQTGKKPTLEEINKVTGGKSPRSASLVIERLVRLGFLKKYGNNLKLTEKPIDTLSVSTVNVPLIGHVACGLPMLAKENIEAYIPVSTRLAKPGGNYFLLRANGDSMDMVGINHGDLILVRQQATANNGEQVVALINDEATVKELYYRGDYVTLLPRSSNPIHKPIILTEQFVIQGIVRAIIPLENNLMTTI